MDKETINRRDAELLEKVDTIIKEKELMKRRRLLATRVLFFVIIICGLVPVYIVLKPEKGNTSSGQQVLESVMTSPTAESTRVLTQTSFSEQPEKLQVEPKQHPAPEETDTAGTDMPHSMMGEPVEKITENSPRKTTDTTSRRQPENADKTQERKIYVSRSAVCAALDNRNPVDPRNAFVIGQDRYAIAWTEIQASHFPTRLTHVYYLNGEKYCEVPLSAKYPRTRTWSKITLIDENQVGAWEVVVMEERGNILKQLEFLVKPS